MHIYLAKNITENGKFSKKFVLGGLVFYNNIVETISISIQMLKGIGQKNTLKL